MKIATQQHEPEKVDLPDLTKLKELSERLQLPSKRESIIVWQKGLEELQSEGVYPVAGGAKIFPRSSHKTKLKTAATAHSPQTKYRDKTSIIFEYSPSGVEEEPDQAQVICESNTTRYTPTLSPEHHDNIREKYFRKKSLEESVDYIKKYAMSDQSLLGKTEAQEDKLSSVSHRHQLIELALQKLRRDLLDMRISDNAIARKLLEKRREFLQAKAVKTCDQHATMIDDYSWELEQEDDIAEQLRSCDLPCSSVRSSTTVRRSTSRLKLMGISRMTFDSKRFSVI